MPKLPAKKTTGTARKRPTREQLDEALAIPLRSKGTGKASSAPQPVDAASRQRIRDRAGD